MKVVIRRCAVFLAISMAAPLFAQDSTAVDKRISDLEKKVEQLEREKLAKEGPAAQRTEVAGFYDKGSLLYTSPDGAFRYWLDGRVNLDAATYRGAANRLPSGFEVRRGRLGLKTALFRSWLAELDFEFADNETAIKDLWAGYAGFRNSVIRIGNHKIPFGLETLTSSKYISFIERPYVDSWAPDRHLGISYSRWGRNWQFSSGIFGQPAGDFNDKESLTGGGAGTSQRANLAGRFSVAPLNEKGRVFHVGVAAARMQPAVGEIATSGEDLPDRLDAAQVVKLEARPETHVSRAKFLSTGDMKYVDSYDMLGGEVAGIFGAIDFQSEYQRVKVNRLNSSVADVAGHTFDGYYGQVGWFVTGETRPYSSSEGRFGRLIPNGKWGALQLLLRYSTLDLNDLTRIDPIAGGSARNVTAGATWFINANHKIMVNVTQVDNDKHAKPGKDWAPLPSGTDTTLTPVAGDDFTIIAVRYQVAF